MYTERSDSLGMMEEIRQLREEIAAAQNWHEMLCRVDSGTYSMGSWQYPAPECEGLTWGQWQHERAKRQTLAVLDYLIAEMTDSQS